MMQAAPSAFLYSRCSVPRLKAVERYETNIFDFIVICLAVTRFFWCWPRLLSQTSPSYVAEKGVFKMSRST